MPSKLRKFAQGLPGYPILRTVYHAVKGIGATEEPWVRVVMNRETLAMVNALKPETLEVLEVSGVNWKDFPFKRYTTVDFPEFDLCEHTLDRQFDLIIAQEVFEHVLWPYRAAKNVYTMLEPGGHFLISAPFLLRVHAYPTDCSRWTEVGLKYLLAECGFDPDRIQTGSWGNRACVKANFIEWAPYRPWFHSLKNEPNFPVSVWALAQK